MAGQYHMYRMSWDDNPDRYKLCQHCGGRVRDSDRYILVGVKWIPQRSVCELCLHYYDIIYGDTFYTATEGPNRLLSRRYSYVFYDLIVAKWCSAGNTITPMACVKI